MRREATLESLWSLCASTVLLTPHTVRWGIWNLLVRALNSLHCRCRLCLMRHWVSSLCLAPLASVKLNLGVTLEKGDGHFPTKSVTL